MNYQVVYVDEHGRELSPNGREDFRTTKTKPQEIDTKHLYAVSFFVFNQNFFKDSYLKDIMKSREFFKGREFKQTF